MLLVMMMIIDVVTAIGQVWSLNQFYFDHAHVAFYNQLTPFPIDDGYM